MIVAGYSISYVATYRNTVSILLSNAVGLCLALLQLVLVLELGSHIDGVINRLGYLKV